jgi:hypothetical protein
LAEKFGLNFDLLTRDQIEASVTGNPFIEKNRLIVRLDIAARSDEAVLDGKPFEIAHTALLSRERPSITTSVHEKVSSRGNAM